MYAVLPDYFGFLSHSLHIVTIFVKNIIVKNVNIHIHSWIRFLERTTNCKQTMSSYLEIKPVQLSTLRYIKKPVTNKNLNKKYCTKIFHRKNLCISKNV